MKFVHVDIGVPSLKRWRRRCVTCEFELRCTSISLAMDWIVDKKKVLAPCPCMRAGAYRMWGGSPFMRPYRGLRTCWARLSKVVYRVWLRCAGSGLKSMSELSKVLCAYVVAFLPSFRRVISRRRECTFPMTILFVGLVSPCMLSIVPKCFE